MTIMSLPCFLQLYPISVYYYCHCYTVYRVSFIWEHLYKLKRSSLLFLNLPLHAAYLSFSRLSSHSSLFYTIISYQILGSAQHTVSYASKQMLQKGEQNSYYFLRSMCQVVNGRWVEVKSRSIFIFPFSVSFTLSKEAHVNWLRKER